MSMKWGIVNKSWLITALLYLELILSSRRRESLLGPLSLRGPFGPSLKMVEKVLLSLESLDTL